MAKYNIVESSSRFALLRVSGSSLRQLIRNWNSVTKEVPPENEDEDEESFFSRLEDFWDEVKSKNPFWIPFKLGIGDVEEIQLEIDRLTLKAERDETFAENEREFLVALYSWIAWGGLLKWYPEASKLLRHYLNGNGDSVTINSGVYESSAIVKYAMGEMKKLMIYDVSHTGTIRDGGKLTSQGTLKDTPRSSAEQKVHGAIVMNGTLLAEQDNKRLKNADNKFPLQATCTILSKSPISLKIKWLVTSVWDYESFADQKSLKLKLITELPLTNGSILKLPDGLSRYLVNLGLAHPFNYKAEWDEKYND